METALNRLLREWVVLVAILAMVLGPLALGVGRSLAAQERVNVAAGLVPLPLCQSGDAIDGLAAKTGGGACDHCSAALNGPPVFAAAVSLNAVYANVLSPADTAPSTLLAQVSLPPATGPPVS
jgi:hypothetical protein